MQHRAFLFDFDAFHKTLKTTLEDALRSGSTDELIRFIEKARHSLKDPYEGGALPSDWRELYSADDAHQLGDVALTMFYDPKEDCGLGLSWEAIAETLEPIAATLGYSPVLGHTVGPRDNIFDPGKMGAYFLSEIDVKRAIAAISEVPDLGKIADLAQLLKDAKSARLGLYVTF